MDATQRASRVMEQVEEEAKAVESEIPALMAQLPELQRKYDRAWDRLGDNKPNSPMDPKREAEFQRASYALNGVYSKIQHVKAKAKRLRSPAEFDRRMGNQESLDRLRRHNMAEKTAKVTAKDQGIPAVYLNEAGNFRIGMDARLKSDLVATLVGSPNENALATFTQAQAQKFIDARGWQSFVDRKREIVAAKERSKAENAQKREEAARERAAAKEAAKAEKAAAKAAADAEKAQAAEATAPNPEKGDLSGVNPAPKPTSSRKTAGARR